MHDSPPATSLPTSRSLDQDGDPVTLSALRGSKVVLYFYPEAMTPGCTTEACDFRDSLNSFAGAGVRVLGVSKDDVAKLARVRRARPADVHAALRHRPRRAAGVRRLGREDRSTARPSSARSARRS